METLVTVIIPIYCVETYLEQCINSVVQQTHTELEIILVDDGSPDQCPVICDAWAKRDSRIIVIHKKNGGLSDARNAGIDRANGNYIMFVDSDDWIEPNMVECMLSVLEEQQADICACGIFYEYPQKTSIREVDSFVGSPTETYKRLYDETRYPVSAWNKLYSRKCWNKLRFPTGKICEDAFTTYLLIDQAQTIVQLSTPYYHYRIRDNSIMTSQFSVKKMDEEEAWRNNYLFIKEHYPEHARAAYNFYLLRVNGLINTITKELRTDYQKEYKNLNAILKKNMGYILFESGLPLKRRFRYIYDCISLH